MRCAVSLNQLLSPLLVYPVKFASLYSLYRLFSCTTCYLSPTPPHPAARLSSALHAGLAGGLAGLVVSAPRMSWRLSGCYVAGCGLVGGVGCVAQMGLVWVGERLDALGERDSRRDAAAEATAAGLNKPADDG